MSAYAAIVGLQALNERLAQAETDVRELGLRVARALYEENVGPDWERERVVCEVAA